MSIVKLDAELVEVNPEEEAIFLQELKKDENFKNYLTSQELQFYENYVESGCDFSNYKNSPYYKVVAGIGEIDTQGLIDRSIVRRKKTVVNFFLDSLELNAKLALTIENYKSVKEGEKIFFAELCNETTGFTKQEIKYSLDVARRITLKQAFELQDCGVSITALKRIAAPETPTEAVIEELITEAKENGTTLSVAVVNDVIDSMVNGSSSVLDEMMNNQQEEEQKNNSETTNDENQETETSVDSEDVINVEATSVAKDRLPVNTEFAGQREAVLEKANAVEDIKPSFEPEEGSLYLNPEKFAVLKELMQTWADKHDVETVRGDAVSKVLSDLNKLVPEFELKIQEKKAKGKAKK